MNELDRPANIGEPPPVRVKLHAGLLLVREENGSSRRFRFVLSGDIAGELRGLLASVAESASVS